MGSKQEILRLLEDPSRIDHVDEENKLEVIIQMKGSEYLSVKVAKCSLSEQQQTTGFYLCCHKSKSIQLLGEKLIETIVELNKLDLEAVLEAFHTFNELMKQRELPRPEHKTFIKSSNEAFWNGIFISIKLIPKETFDAVVREFPSFLLLVIKGWKDWGKRPRTISNETLRWSLYSFGAVVKKLENNVWRSFDHETIFSDLIGIIKTTSDDLVLVAALENVKFLLNYTQSNELYRKYSSDSFDVLAKISKEGNEDRKQFAFSTVERIINDCFTDQNNEFTERLSFTETTVKIWVDILLHRNRVEIVKSLIETILKAETLEFQKKCYYLYPSQGVPPSFHNRWLSYLWKKVITYRTFEDIIFTLAPYYLRVLPQKSSNEDRFYEMEQILISFWKNLPSESRSKNIFNAKVIYFFWTPSVMIRSCVEESIKQNLSTTSRQYFRSLIREKKKVVEDEYYNCVLFQTKGVRDGLNSIKNNPFLDVFFDASKDIIEESTFSTKTLRYIWILFAHILMNCVGDMGAYCRSMFICAKAIIVKFKEDENLYLDQVLDSAIRWVPPQGTSEKDAKLAAAYYGWLKLYLKGFVGKMLSGFIVTTLASWIQLKSSEMHRWGMWDILLEVVESSNEYYSTNTPGVIPRVGTDSHGNEIFTVKKEKDAPTNRDPRIERSDLRRSSNATSTTHEPEERSDLRRSSNTISHVPRIDLPRELRNKIKSKEGRTQLIDDTSLSKKRYNSKGGITFSNRGNNSRLPKRR